MQRIPRRDRRAARTGDAHTLPPRMLTSNTRHRTGIMLFVSFFEHEVIVMSDRGISKVVDQKEWENIVRMITSGISGGNVIGGMESAIHRCGEILLEKGFLKETDDTNELSDNLRVD